MLRDNILATAVLIIITKLIVKEENKFERIILFFVIFEKRANKTIESEQISREAKEVHAIPYKQIDREMLYTAPLKVPKSYSTPASRITAPVK